MEQILASTMTAIGLILGLAFLAQGSAWGFWVRRWQRPLDGTLRQRAILYRE